MPSEGGQSYPGFCTISRSLSVNVETVERRPCSNRDSLPRDSEAGSLGRGRGSHRGAQGSLSIDLGVMCKSVSVAKLGSLSRLLRKSGQTSSISPAPVESATGDADALTAEALAREPGEAHASTAEARAGATPATGLGGDCGEAETELQELAAAQKVRLASGEP